MPAHQEMNNQMKRTLLFTVSLILMAGSTFSQRFSVRYADSILKEPFSGHVILYLSKENKEPKGGRPGLDRFPCFKLYVKDVQPGKAINFDDHAVSFPVPLTEIERGNYYVQVVWDRNLGGRSIAGSPGNLYSLPVQVEIGKKRNRVYQITATQKVPPAKFQETPFIKEIQAPSALLSEFYRQPVTINAAVHLPAAYLQDKNRKFPVLYTISGFGGDYHRYSSNDHPAAALDTTACINVYLDGNCALGHSYYANSDNNGPWGDALIKELIPAIERLYRTNGARLLTGHSSGGWAALWLQTHYPKEFQGCWSSSPDPVDFRSFQKVNLYEDKNMYYAADSSLNQTGTVAGLIPWFSMQTIYQMEHVIYRGEQMHSFDAAFSKIGIDGRPQRICNYRSGEIDTPVFEHWKKYDISRYLLANWNSLKSDLDGKVRLTVGSSDNFYLNHAVQLLDSHMKQHNAKFETAYYPGDHITVMTPAYQKDGYLFLARKYQEWITARQR
jgi:enterochelin esterase-like enzyme